MFWSRCTGRPISSFVVLVHCCLFSVTMAVTIIATLWFLSLTWCQSSWDFLLVSSLCLQAIAVPFCRLWCVQASDPSHVGFLCISVCRTACWYYALCGSLLPLCCPRSFVVVGGVAPCILLIVCLMVFVMLLYARWFLMASLHPCSFVWITIFCRSS